MKRINNTTGSISHASNGVNLLSMSATDPTALNPFNFNGPFAKLSLNTVTMNSTLDVPIPPLALDGRQHRPRAPIRVHRRRAVPIHITHEPKHVRALDLLSRRVGRRRRKLETRRLPLARHVLIRRTLRLLVRHVVQDDLPEKARATSACVVIAIVTATTHARAVADAPRCTTTDVIDASPPSSRARRVARAIEAVARVDRVRLVGVGVRGVGVARAVGVIARSYLRDRWTVGIA